MKREENRRGAWSDGCVLLLGWRCVFGARKLPLPRMIHHHANDGKAQAWKLIPPSLQKPPHQTR
jgi:hypothetical protein